MGRIVGNRTLCLWLLFIRPFQFLMVLYPNLLPSPFSMQNHALGHNLFLKRGGTTNLLHKISPFFTENEWKIIAKSLLLMAIQSIKTFRKTNILETILIANLGEKCLDN